MNVKKIIITCLFLITVSISAVEYKITELNISGLKRTRKATVLNIIDLSQGDNISLEDSIIIEQKLKKAGLFTNDIVVDIVPINDIEATLNLTLSDKWTLIPLPIVVVSKNTTLFGGIFIESNLLGLNQSLISGVFYTETSLSALTAWSLPPFSFGDISLSMFYLNAEQTKNDFWGNELEGTDVNSISASTTYKKEIKDYYTPSLSIRYNNLNTKNHLSLNPSILLSDITILDSFQKGYSVELNSINKIFIDDSFIANQVSGKIQISQILLKNLLYLNINSAYSFDEENFPVEFGASNGSKALKGEIETPFYLNAQLKYEIKILSFSWGYITIPVYYEAGITEIESDYLGYNGPGIGLLSYLNKIALPAVGASFTYDLINDRWNWDASVGMSM